MRGYKYKLQAGRNMQIGAFVIFISCLIFFFMIYNFFLILIGIVFFILFFFGGRAMIKDALKEKKFIENLEKKAKGKKSENNK